MPQQNMKQQDCKVCGAMNGVFMSQTCGCHVCIFCDNHQGLARCFCGWSSSGRNGRIELEEMGETIEPD